ncbi:serine-rich adhesin for platelets [Aplysia californica]|uniref:Serine-rich adhesin for platelets n=1 Tax=Aplysia californica TaxID=6500 RepID=A0ABM0K3F6_APLCA|nr:serine-rich adhesin for platelets [Aplysia californica]
MAGSNSRPTGTRGRPTHRTRAKDAGQGSNLVTKKKNDLNQANVRSMSSKRKISVSSTNSSRSNSVDKRKRMSLRTEQSSSATSTSDSAPNQERSSVLAKGKTRAVALGRLRSSFPTANKKAAALRGRSWQTLQRTIRSKQSSQGTDALSHEMKRLQTTSGFWSSKASQRTNSPASQTSGGGTLDAGQTEASTADTPTPPKPKRIPVGKSTHKRTGPLSEVRRLETTRGFSYPGAMVLGPRVSSKTSRDVSPASNSSQDRITASGGRSTAQNSGPQNSSKTSRDASPASNSSQERMTAPRARSSAHSSGTRFGSKTSRDISPASNSSQERTTTVSRSASARQTGANASEMSEKSMSPAPGTISLGELRRLVTTEGFWSPSFGEHRGRSSRDLSPASTSSVERDRLGRSRSGGQDVREKGSVKDSAVSVSPVTPGSASRQTGKSNVSVQKSCKKQESELMDSSAAADITSPGPAVRRTRRKPEQDSELSNSTDVLVKEEVARSQGRKRKLPEASLSTSAKKSVVSESREEVQALQSSELGQAEPKGESSSRRGSTEIFISDLLGSSELKRLDTTPGFWAPTPDIGFVLSRSSARRSKDGRADAFVSSTPRTSKLSATSPTRKPQSSLLQHRKKKLQSLKAALQKTHAKRGKVTASQEQKTTALEPKSATSSQDDEPDTDGQGKKKRKKIYFGTKKRRGLKGVSPSMLKYLRREAKENPGTEVDQLVSNFYSKVNNKSRFVRLLNYVQSAKGKSSSQKVVSKAEIKRKIQDSTSRKSSTVRGIEKQPEPKGLRTRAAVKQEVEPVTSLEAKVEMSDSSKFSSQSAGEVSVSGAAANCGSSDGESRWRRVRGLREERGPSAEKASVNNNNNNDVKQVDGVHGAQALVDAPTVENSGERVESDMSCVEEGDVKKCAMESAVEHRKDLKDIEKEEAEESVPDDGECKEEVKKEEEGTSISKVPGCELTEETTVEHNLLHLDSGSGAVDAPLTEDGKSSSDSGQHISTLALPESLASAECSGQSVVTGTDSIVEPHTKVTDAVNTSPEDENSAVDEVDNVVVRAGATVAEDNKDDDGVVAKEVVASPEETQGGGPVADHKLSRPEEAAIPSDIAEVGAGSSSCSQLTGSDATAGGSENLSAANMMNDQRSTGTALTPQTDVDIGPTEGVELCSDQPMPEMTCQVPPGSAVVVSDVTDSVSSGPVRESDINSVAASSLPGEVDSAAGERETRGADNVVVGESGGCDGTQEKTVATDVSGIAHPHSAVGSRRFVVKGRKGRKFILNRKKPHAGDMKESNVGAGEKPPSTLLSRSHERLKSPLHRVRKRGRSGWQRGLMKKHSRVAKPVWRETRVSGGHTDSASLPETGKGTEVGLQDPVSSALVDSEADAVTGGITGSNVSDGGPELSEGHLESDKCEIASRGQSVVVAEEAGDGSASNAPLLTSECQEKNDSTTNLLLSSRDAGSDGVVDVPQLASEIEGEKNSHLSQLPQPDGGADLERSGPATLSGPSVSTDKGGGKKKKFMAMLKRLRTDANLANATLDEDTLNTRAKRGILPVQVNLQARRTRLRQDNTVRNVSSKLKRQMAGGLGKQLKIDIPTEADDGKKKRGRPRKLSGGPLPQLTPSGTLPASQELNYPPNTTPPTLSPQVSLDPATTKAELDFSGSLLERQEFEAVPEGVDEDYHLYLSGVSDDDTSTSPLKGTSVSPVKFPVTVAPPDLTAQDNVGGTSALSLKEPQTDGTHTSLPAAAQERGPVGVAGRRKMKGKRGQPPGLPMSEEDTFKRPRTARKSMKVIKDIYPLLSTHSSPSTSGRKFEFRKKSTRSPIEMLEMKRRQEEAIYDQEEERRLARLQLLRQKRNARLTFDEDASFEGEGSEGNLRPCAVVLSDFVKKLQLDAFETQPDHAADTYGVASPGSSVYEEDDDEDWCADLEDLQDEDEEEWSTTGTRESRPYIPRLKIKRVLKKGKEAKGKLRESGESARVPSHHEPIKLIIKTETSPGSESMGYSANVTTATVSSAQGFDLDKIARTGFESSYLEFLKGKQGGEKSKPVKKKRPLLLVQQPATGKEGAVKPGVDQQSTSGDSTHSPAISQTELTKSSSPSITAPELTAQLGPAPPVKLGLSTSHSVPVESTPLAADSHRSVADDEDEDILIVDLDETPTDTQGGAEPGTDRAKTDGETHTAVTVTRDDDKTASETCGAALTAGVDVVGPGPVLNVLQASDESESGLSGSSEVGRDKSRLPCPVRKTLSNDEMNLMQQSYAPGSEEPGAFSLDGKGIPAPVVGLSGEQASTEKDKGGKTVTQNTETDSQVSGKETRPGVVSTLPAPPVVSDLVISGADADASRCCEAGQDGGEKERDPGSTADTVGTQQSVTLLGDSGTMAAAEEKGEQDMSVPGSPAGQDGARVEVAVVSESATKSKDDRFSSLSTLTQSQTVCDVSSQNSMAVSKAQTVTEPDCLEREEAATSTANDDHSSGPEPKSPVSSGASHKRADTSESSKSPKASSLSPIGQTEWKLKHILLSDKQASGKYSCKRCGFSAGTKLTIESHIYSHIPGVQFRCAYCESEFSSMAATSTHLKNTHLVKEAKFHISRHIDEKNFYEKEEGSPARTPAAPQVSASPTGEAQSPPVYISVVVSGNVGRGGRSASSRRFVCTHCGFSTNVRDDAEHHVSDLHSSQSLYACILCDENVFYSEPDIKQHSATVHPTRTRPYRRLPDFYDAERLHKKEEAANAEDSPENILGRVSSMLHREDSDLEAASIDHRQKAKDYLYLQEGWKEKRSAEADSTTAVDYTEEAVDNDVDDPAADDAALRQGEETWTGRVERVGGGNEVSSRNVPSTNSSELSPSLPAETGSLKHSSSGDISSTATARGQAEEEPLAEQATVVSGGLTAGSSGDGDQDKSAESRPEGMAGDEPISQTSVPSSQPSGETPPAPGSDTRVAASSETDKPPALDAAEPMEATAPPEAGPSDGDSSGLKIVEVVSLSGQQDSPFHCERSTAAVSQAEALWSSPQTSVSGSVSVTASAGSPSCDPTLSTQATTGTMSPLPSQHSTALGPSGDASKPPQPSSTPTTTTTSSITMSSACASSSLTTTTTSAEAPTSSSSSSSTETPQPSSSGGRLPLSYKCSACKVHTPYLLMMVKHLKAKHPLIDCFACPYCKKALCFSSQKQLRIHIKNHHPDKLSRNEISLSDEAKKLVEAMVLPSSPECVRVGNRLVLEEDIHTCTYCHLKMTSLASVYEHLNDQHSDLFEFVCPVCQSFKHKVLAEIATHCSSAHQTSLDTDKVHVSVPKNLFSVLTCISRNGKYIEKTLEASSSSSSSSQDTSSDTASKPPPASSLDLSSTSKSKETTDVQKESTEQQKVAEASSPAVQQTAVEMSASKTTTTSAVTPPVACTGAPVPLISLISRTPLIAIPLTTVGTSVSTRPVIAFSSALFDTSSMPGPPPAALAAPAPPLGLVHSAGAPAAASFLSPRQLLASSTITKPQSLRPAPSLHPKPPHQSQTHGAGSGAGSVRNLPVLNVPTIRPRPSSSSPARSSEARSYTSSPASSSPSPLAHSFLQPPATSTTTATSATADSLPDVEPNPDAFKIFNLRPMAPAAPSASPSPSAPAMFAGGQASSTPTVFPPVSGSSLPGGYLPGHMAGLPPGIVIPPNLLPQGFSYPQVPASSPGTLPTTSSKSRQPTTSRRHGEPAASTNPSQAHSKRAATTALLLKQQREELYQLKQQQLSRHALELQRQRLLSSQLKQQQPQHPSPMVHPAFPRPHLLPHPVATLQARPGLSIPFPIPHSSPSSPAASHSPLSASPESHSVAPPPSVGLAQAGQVGARPAKGVHKRSSSLYQCPYCPSGVRLKAIEVPSHIQQQHPGQPVLFKKVV